MNAAKTVMSVMHGSCERGHVVMLYYVSSPSPSHVVIVIQTWNSEGDATSFVVVVVAVAVAAAPWTKLLGKLRKEFCQTPRANRRRRRRRRPGASSWAGIIL